MPTKHAILVGLGDYYADFGTGLDSLPFVYKNVDDLSQKLDELGWKVYPAILDNLAGKEKIIKYLDEKIGLLEKDDWLLFYYTGHGDRRARAGALDDMFLVNFSDKLRVNQALPFDDFIFDAHYNTVINKFHGAAPDGHLITILDCCYAFGLIDNFKSQKDFHTVFAASQADSEAFYSNNSFFFKALSQSWNESNLEDMQGTLENRLALLSRISECRIQLAEKFSSQSL